MYYTYLKNTYIYYFQISYKHILDSHHVHQISTHMIFSLGYLKAQVYQYCPQTLQEYLKEMITQGIGINPPKITSWVIDNYQKISLLVYQKLGPPLKRYNFRF